MKTTQKLCGLVVLSLIAAAMLRPQAGAEFVGPTPLGPASELVLEGDDTKAITIKVNDGHLAWGTAATHRLYSEGYVAIGSLLDALMSTDSFVEERQQLSEQVQKDEQRISAAIEVIRSQIDGLEKDDPTLPGLMEEGRALFQQRQSFLKMAQQAQSQLAGEQLERAYRELVEAVKIVAESKKIDIVHRFIPTDDDFKGKAHTEALNEIRMRNLLVYPESLDITSEVADELGVEVDGS